MEILQKFYSKKNNVYLAHNGSSNIVCKIFKLESNYIKEKTYYELLKNSNLNIPLIISYEDATLTMLIEYLSDTTALDIIESYESKNDIENAVALLIKIFLWIDSFHALPGIRNHSLSLYDVSFRNFIVKDNQIYSIDFESVEKGSLLEDVARLIAMYLNYDQKNSPFKVRAVFLFKEYLINNSVFLKENLEAAIDREILILNERRKEKNML
jgi:hypothetical protein